MNHFNIILELSIYAWAAAQLLKVLFNLVKMKKFDLRPLFSSGGMPSSHSAFVTACACSTGVVVGWDSPLFALAAVFAFVVMYDAANVRQAAGQQARLLNYIMDNWADMKPSFFTKDLKELLGHTPVQVAAGALLVTVIGLLAYVI